MLKKINFVHTKTITVLPTVFTDSLSYLEDIGKLISKINEIVNNYNVLSEYYNSLDGLLESIQSKIDELENDVINFKAEINSEFADLEQKLIGLLNNSISELNTEFNRLKKDIQKQQNDFEEIITDKLNKDIENINNTIESQLKEFNDTIEANKIEIYNYLNTELQKFKEQIPEWQNVMVVNPTTGTLEPLQKVVNDMYELITDVEGLTAKEYDSLNLTAYEYDNFIINSIPCGLTAFNYDFYGRRYLYIDPNFIMTHPYYGKRGLYKKVVEFNTDLLSSSGTYTASEWDYMNFTAAEMDEKNLTAVGYDWKNNRIFI